ncbi:MAG: peptidylprolyl isomerase [Gammaproteobacteria bacterium]|nr:peptidylprolyl isomerase [Gammaproteobacteria bacterium]
MTHVSGKKIALTLFAVSGIFFSTAQITNAATPAKNNEQSLDKIVTVINDSVITESELDDAIEIAKKQIAINHIATPPSDILRKQVLDQLINRKLQLMLGEQAGVHIDEAAVDKAVATIAAQNKLSVPELYEQLKKQGMQVKAYRKEIGEEIILQQIQQQEVGSHITITPQEVDDFMRSAAWLSYNNKEYHLEDILIALPDTPTPEDVEHAKKEADAVLAKIHQGTSFQEAAVSNSGSTGAMQGGDLGWRKLPQIPSAFANELIHMKQNDIMGPILTPNGFHIIKLSGLRDADKKIDATEQHKQVEQLLYQRKFEEELQSWTTKLRGQAFIHNTEK